MAVTRFQSEVLKLIARSRISSGETYIAGGLALNYQLQRRSGRLCWQATAVFSVVQPKS